MFTKVLKPIIAICRRQGIRIIVFLDDILIISSSACSLQQDLTFCLQLLCDMGFIINVKKSHLHPVTRLGFLGLILDTQLMKLFVPEEKIQDIMSLGTLILSANHVKLRDLSKFIGKVNAIRMALLPSLLFARHLQQVLIHGLKIHRSYDAYVSLLPEARQELQLWLAEVWTWNGRNIIPPDPSLTITSDASNSGWGAVCSQGTSVNGAWTALERRESINYLEQMAAFLALKSFAANCTDCHILIQSDNKTTVAYLNRLGGTRSEPLIQLAIQIWQWSLHRRLTLEAVHVPGLQNMEADSQSRKPHHCSDWCLNPQLFQLLNRRFGPFQIDLFAACHNAQMRPFFSWLLDPEAAAIDAFSQPWSLTLAYAFPPFDLLPRVLKKVQTDQASLALIAPVWPSQPWYPLLLELLAQAPCLLPDLPNLLTAPSGNAHPLVLNGTFRLALWPVSGKLCLTQAYRRSLPILSCASLRRVLLSSTVRPFENGVVGVTDGRLIHFSPL